MVQMWGKVDIVCKYKLVLEFLKAVQMFVLKFNIEPQSNSTYANTPGHIPEGN